MKNILIILALLIILTLGLVPFACRPGGSESVLLRGGVTIGPISPVERPGENLPVPPEVFKERQIMIYDASGKKLVREVNITQIGQGPTGYYTAQIAPGTYTIDINRTGMDRVDNLPQKITISADETVTIDIDIDTGIR